MGITINDYILLFSGNSLAADLTSIAIDVTKITSYAIQIGWTGSPVGNFKLQANCDQQPTASSVWEDITGASVAAGGASGSTIFNYGATPGTYWIRLVYKSTSGTGNITSAKYNGKG